MSGRQEASRLISKAIALIIVTILIVIGIRLEPAEAKGAITSASVRVQAGGRAFQVQTVSIPKGTPVTLGLAKRQVGQTEAFTSIVKNYRATAAINGAFFNAYGGPADPYGTLIVKGRLAHFGGYGTSIGFLPDGTAIMASLRSSLTGTVTTPQGQSLGWYAVFLNRTPSDGANTIIKYTPDRGSRVGFTGGIAVTIAKGVVIDKGTNTNVAIPSNGYVLVFTGSEKKSADRFVKGSTVEESLVYKDDQGNSLPWEHVVTAVGAGPRLVRDGQVELNAKAEGFNDPKILTSSAARSGIAIMPDGSLILATVNGATMQQWAAIMKALGAKQAMNLDGGASSALYANGKVLTQPGRSLSNVLVFGSNVN
ncbi:exopolysaccharide biosynthesis protein [Paenibacillus shirakamiensis]|uniref:Exopolysaccharide biosynthesis protein n=1 Tax=Paenibacillus shirakamiensis TaxID=1265935 RepID=A0ABS4JFF8_9BACL|nr:phosphodiester glycosidase family protein [Paenibacillus shirakamiensis]MBP2000448.1 exopolysaccharide biosynthesis protein [Paenibacillus shirakamiensis]